MIDKGRYKLVLILLGLLAITDLIAQLPDKKRLSYGGSIIPVINVHTSQMNPPKPMSICCPFFTEGNGLGYDVSVFGTYAIQYNHGIQASFGYRNLQASTYANQELIINKQNEKGFVQSSLESDLSIIYFQLLYNYTLLHRLEASLGLNVGINSSKNYTYKEELVNQTIAFDNGTTIRNVSSGALAGINPRYFGGVIGLSYGIPLFKNHLFIKPTIQYTYGLRPIQYNVNWYANSLVVGLNWEFKPNGEIERPVSIEIPTYPDIIVDSSHLQIIQNQSRIINTYSTIYEYPMLHDLYSSIFKSCNSDTLLKNDTYTDNGSYYYSNILDTLSKRLTQFPHTKLRLGISPDIYLDSHSLSSCLEYHHIPSNRIQYEILPVTTFPRGVVSRILSDELSKPFISVKNDTLVINPKLSFRCIGKDSDSIQWGIYDQKTKTVIVKGEGVTNTDIVINEIPKAFKKGKLRTIYKNRNGNSIIETDILISDSIVSIYDSIPIESGVLFDIDSDSIMENQIHSLQLLQARLSIKDSLTIEAFTDLTGDFHYNMLLAEKRAKRIIQYFPGVHTDIILSPLKKRNSGLEEYQKAYNRIVIITRKKP